MTICMNYIILSATLVIGEQMWLVFSFVFCLSDTFRNSKEDGPLHICIIKHTLHDKHEARLQKLTE